MRIAQFTTTMDGGGAETMILALTQQLTEKGHPTTIFGFEDSWIINRAEELHLPFHSLGKKFKKKNSVYKIPFFGWEFSKILKNRFDLLHSHVFKATLRGASTTYFANIPHIATQHDIYTIEEKPSRSKWLNIAGALGTELVMLSDQMRDTYIKHGIRKKYCSVIHNGVDTSKFEPNKQNTEDFTFITVGRLEKVKGYDILLKSFKHLPYKLLIVGDGPERKVLERIVEDNDLSNRVDFLGERRDIPKLLNEADAYICSSHSEGLSYSILEAMSCGLPIVATDVGANRLLVQDNGILVQPNNTRHLKKAMLDITSKQTQSMGERSRETVLKHFSLDVMVDTYIDLYNKH